MPKLDFARVDLYADDDRWSRLQCGVDVPTDCRRVGYAVLASRPGVLVAAKGGKLHLIRQTPIGRFDGVHMVEALELDIRYDDDTEIVDPA